MFTVLALIIVCFGRVVWASDDNIPGPDNLPGTIDLFPSKAFTPHTMCYDTLFLDSRVPLSSNQGESNWVIRATGLSMAYLAAETEKERAWYKRAVELTYWLALRSAATEITGNDDLTLLHGKEVADNMPASLSFSEVRDLIAIDRAFSAAELRQRQGGGS